MQTIRSYGRTSEIFDLGVSSRPFVGERVSGDLVWFRQDGDEFHLTLIDALGHGERAHLMAKKIASSLEESTFSTLTSMVRLMHDAARSELGAAASLVRIDTAEGLLETVTIGNTTVRIVDQDGPRDAPPTPGVLGQSIRTPLAHSTRLAGGEVILLFSDGVTSNFDESMYRRLKRTSAEAMSRLLLRRHGSTVDDATLVVLKYLKR
jgi:serine phosphatase RsbU (regulator of sigma subunit)